MIENRRVRRNRTSNEQKNKIRDVMSIREGYNQDLVSVSIDGLNEDQGHQKEVSDLSPQKIPTVDLTATSNSELFQWIPLTTKNKL